MNDIIICNDCKIRLFAAENFKTAWQAQNGGEGYSYTHESKAIRDNAKLKCVWCKTLTETTPFIQNKVKDEVSVTVAFKFTGPLHTLYLRLIIDKNYIHPYEVYADPDDPAAKLLTQRELIYKVNTPEAFKSAQKELDACANLKPGHKNCREAQKRRLPTRVIDCQDSPKLKLHVAPPSELDFYAALSYCWGTDPPPYLTNKENLETRTSQGFNISDLPKTISEAVTCTQKLGQRYLWVDALCIIQDSPEDKVKELPQMCDIYRNAYMTIIVANAKGVKEGFLSDDGPTPPPATQIPFMITDKVKGTMWIREPRVESMPDDPINDRGWCFQERVLTERSVIYSSHGLRFSCISTDSHAVGMADNAFYVDILHLPLFMFYYDQPDKVNEKIKDDELMKDNKLTSDQVKEIRLQNSWRDVIAEYTRRELSYPLDKLEAIGGVITVFRAFRADSDYLAGLWAGNLLEGLLWQCGDVQPRPIDKKTSEAPYIAPSWSWAAVNGKTLTAQSAMEILWPKQSYYLAEVAGYGTTLKNKNNPFGAVTQGFVDLKASLHRVTWYPGICKTKDTLSRLCTYDTNIELTRNAPPDCREEVIGKRNVFAVPIRRCKGKDLNSFEGILVERLEGSPPKYCRVGSFTIGNPDHIQGFDPDSWEKGEKEQFSIL